MSHVSDNNETYLSHLLFAGTAGIHFTVAGVMFLVHAVLPFIQIPARFNIEGMRDKVERWDEYALKRRRK
jgi:DNA-binding transcriptional regulator/RsmH inhibitor MraZ